MAIVFISPKKKQRTFLVIITVCLVLFLVAISALVFGPEFIQKAQYTTADMSFIKPNVIINLDTVNSQEVKNLQPFEGVETTFAYIVTDKNNRRITGTISAVDQASAQALLEQSGFKVVSVQETSPGRSNPFIK